MVFFFAFVMKNVVFGGVFHINGNCFIIPLFYIDINIFFAQKVEKTVNYSRRKPAAVLS